MPITLHTDESEEVPEQTELVAGHVRDEFQQSVDKDVAILKLATAKAGWPKPDATKLFHRYVTDAKDKAELKQVIRRAASLHKTVPVFYKDGKTAAGHISVKFHLARRPVMEDGHPKMENGKPVFVKDETLDDNGRPKAA